MISIEELIKPVTEEEALEKLLSILETLGLPSRSWRTGGVIRTIVHAVARTYADFTTLMAAVIRGGFLETAEGQWLTLLAYHVFGVERRGATFAQGEATFTNSGGLVFNEPIGQVRIKNTTTGKLYENTEALVLGANETATIAIQAVEQGSDSSAAPNTITTMETFLLDVTVTNATAVLGSDEETDAELRVHCKNKLAALSVRGPRGAYEFAVREAKRDDGSPVDVNRLSVSSDSSTGQVTVYVASPTGVPSSEDIEAIEEAIETYARPDSVTVTVTAATEKAFTRSVTVYAERTDGVDAAGLKADVEAALLEFFRLYRIGGRTKPPQSSQGYLYTDLVARVIIGAHASIYDCDGLGADMTLNPGEVATNAITLTVRIIEER